MKIMMVDPLLSTPPYDEALCSALADAGHEVFLVGRRRGPDEIWLVPQIRYLTLDLINLLKTPPRSKLPRQIATLVRHVHYGWVLLSLASLARREKPDVIHFQWCLTPLADRIILTLLPPDTAVVYTMHDTDPFNGGRVSKLLTFGLDGLLRRFDAIIVHTQVGVDTLKNKGLELSRLYRIAHGPLKLTRVVTVPPPRKTESSTVRFLLFGIMKPYKGIHTLIEAVALLSEDVRKRCSVHVAGKPEMELASLEKAILEYGLQGIIDIDARFIPDEEVQDVFEQADVVLFPYSAIEASGVFSIAMQFGRPIIASSLGAFEEFIDHGRNGLLVVPGDPKSLAGALTEMIEQPDVRKMMAKEVTASFAEYPRWPEIAHAISSVYEAAITKRSS